jgi:hypothetical protein
MRTREWRAFTLAMALIAALGGLVTVAPSAAYAATCPSGPAVAGSALSGVAVTSPTNAWAAGQHYDGKTFQTLTQHWNGKAWNVVASPNPGGTANPADFQAVAATSPSNAWAVGEYCQAPVYQTLIEHWNGTKWSQVPTLNPGRYARLSAVAATSATNAWAVGHYSTSGATLTQETLIEHWNGTTWKPVPSPSPDATPKGGPDLFGVSATSVTNAWAVGDYYPPKLQQILTLIEHWNGIKWVQVPSPDPGSVGLDSLYGVSATATNNAWAVGNYYNGAAYQTLILHWNGTKWSQVPSPNPGGTARGHSLVGVTATAPSNAWAAGTYTNSAGGGVTLILHWNGAKWSQVASPNIGSSFPGDFVLGIAATSAANPWVAGTYCPTTACPARQTLTLHWTGKAWIHVSSP